MRKRLRFICCAVCVFCFSDQTRAFITDPRNYDNVPAEVNLVELNYAYAHSNTSIDTSLVILGASFHANEGTLMYTRYLGFFHHLSWVQASLPIADLSGSIAGTNISGSVTGTADTSYLISTLLKGGPVLSVSQFASYKPVTTLGASLEITAPTGQYDSAKLLNLGSNRWSFKPEFGVCAPFGPQQKWELDGYANATFATDNNAYRGRQTLRQKDLPGVEAHISYSFNNSVFGAIDTRYAFYGPTVLNRVDQNNSQQSFTLGGQLSVSVNERDTLIFGYSKALVHENSTNYAGFAIRLDHTWGKGYR